jgi:hypothetical protein
MSADPATFDTINPQTIDRYSYATNNPLLYVDPTGLNDVLPDLVSALTAAGTPDYLVTPTIKMLGFWAIVFENLGLPANELSGFLMVLKAKDPRYVDPLNYGDAVDVQRAAFHGVLPSGWPSADRLPKDADPSDPLDWVGVGVEYRSPDGSLCPPNPDCGFAGQVVTSKSELELLNRNTLVAYDIIADKYKLSPNTMALLPWSGDQAFHLFWGGTMSYDNYTNVWLAYYHGRDWRLENAAVVDLSQGFDNLIPY